MKNTVILSCWFGDRFNKPNQITSLGDLIRLVKYKVKSILPIKILDWLKIESVIPEIPWEQNNCLFFTNNKRLKKEIIYRGWQYLYLDKEVKDGESIDSSLHAKVVKFLQLDPTVLSELFKYEYIVYMDSRRISDNIEELTSLCDKGILIRNTPRLKSSIWDEVDEAKGQERYARSMNATIDFINERLADGYKHDNRVTNTGLIVYKIANETTRNSIISLCTEVYDSCIKYDQPECQIFWCILSQKYDDIITKIDFECISTRSGF